MSTQPDDAEQRRAAPPVVCYDVNSLPKGLDSEFQEQWRNTLEVVDTVVVPPRDASTFKVPAGYGFRIRCVQGPQVGDLNLWYQHDLSERFFSGKTRQLHASHLTRGDRLWSSLPALRAMATITHDTLEWYGWDADGGGVHDVIGTRCDPYTNRLLKQVDYHYCCHSNLTRALARELNVSTSDAEPHIHDVMNVFMCTGFTLDTHQYFMKASPVRPGDFIEFMAEFDLLGALSSCPGGNCGSEHSSDTTPCYPLEVEILKPDDGVLGRFAEESAKLSVGSYDRSHGIR